VKRGDYWIRSVVYLTVWVAIVVVALALDLAFPGFKQLASGLTLPELVAVLAGILALSELFGLFTHWILARRKKPAAEAAMMGRIYRLGAVLVILLTLAWGLGRLKAFTSAIALFSGMFLGWSLQAPVSGMAAWVLVSLKRPFRPGDRVQFPSLGLTGDVKDIGPMYTVLDQVGGAIGSEEAVGRFILVPNAMLFSQVVINYTMMQEAPYMLDEAVVRFTYDSDWTTAEAILLNAAQEVTHDIIEATGVQPYIRSDMYDYGVYLRLRYQTRVQDRAQIAYEINKRVFQEIQRTPSVDVAIPFIYSYRAGMEAKEEDIRRDKEAKNVRQIEIGRVHRSGGPLEVYDVDQLAVSISRQGLLQPIVVAEDPKGERYDILAGDLRFEACKKLGWKTIPALVVARQENEGK
jgi:small-conductance mechanosensitive channel